MDCQKSDADPILYLYCKEGGFVLLTVYVDDFFLIGNSQSSVDGTISNFMGRLEIRVSHKIEKFLGIMVEDRGNNLKL